MPSRRGFIQTNLFGLGLLAGRAALPAVFSPNTETIPPYHLSTTSMTAGPAPSTRQLTRAVNIASIVPFVRNVRNVLYLARLLAPVIQSTLEHWAMVDTCSEIPRNGAHRSASRRPTRRPARKSENSKSYERTHQPTENKGQDISKARQLIESRLISPVIPSGIENNPIISEERAVKNSKPVNLLKLNIFGSMYPVNSLKIIALACRAGVKLPVGLTYTLWLWGRPWPGQVQALRHNVVN